MWALRRASATSARVHGLNLGAVRPCAGLGVPFGIVEDKSSTHEQSTCTFDELLSSKRCYHTVGISGHFTVGGRSFSSRAGAKSGGEEEDELDDGFSELEAPEVDETTTTTTTQGGGTVEDDTSSVSESELSADEGVEDVLETELTGDTEEVLKKKGGPSELCKLVMDEGSPLIVDALDKYVAGGKEVSQADVYDTLFRLRRRKLYGKALQFADWVEQRKVIEHTERLYASKVDLIAKVRGLLMAEKYVDTIPQSSRVEVIYRTLLANCVAVTNVKKAEHVFNKMKDLGFPLSPFACNQLLLLYKRTDRKKVADVLAMMEKENVEPTLFTYQILIDVKGQSKDVTGMEKIVQTMKDDGIEINDRALSSLARHYAACGLTKKAEAALRELEGDNLQDNLWKCPRLLPIYAEIGRADEVERVWKVCEPKAGNTEFLAAIEAFGKLKNVAQAEAIFNKMSEAFKKLGTRQYTVMLKMYAENKMLNKGKELLKQMGESGCHIGPVAWDAIVKLYVDAGELEKADSILHKAAQKNPVRPLFSSYLLLLDGYAKRGDVHNAEKIFHRMRQVGYVARARPFHALLRAYMTAKAPAYGIKERMKADNIIPSKALAAQLAAVDAFKKTAVSELLD